MDILSLLGIEKSIIVLNKCDLVDEEWTELVEEEIREELAGSFLEKAPIVRVSAATGAGLKELVDIIEKIAEEEVVEKDTATIPRLPIDRAFSLSGFGTITPELFCPERSQKKMSWKCIPSGRQAKYEAFRCTVRMWTNAMPVSGLPSTFQYQKREIGRGCVLAPPGSMKNTDLLDVKMNILDSSMRVLTNHTRLHLFTGTSEILCRAVLLDKEEIGPGESGYVQLRLEEEIALRRGDKFVVRFYSPMETIGGGVVLEPNPSIHRRFQEPVIEDLKRKESGSTADVIEMHVKKL